MINQNTNTVKMSPKPRLLTLLKSDKHFLFYLVFISYCWSSLLMEKLTHLYLLLFSCYMGLLYFTSHFYCSWSFTSSLVSTETLKIFLYTILPSFPRSTFSPPPLDFHLHHFSTYIACVCPHNVTVYHCSVFS